MKKLLGFLFPLLLLSIGTLILAWGPSSSPSALYLTWLHDPTTTMTVQWHTEEKENTKVYFQKEGEALWKESSGSSHLLGQATLLFGDLFVKTAELTDLQPDTVYAFRVGTDKKIYRFRTMQKEPARPIHFVVGGDVYQDDVAAFKKMNAQVAQMDPDFVVLGGDIAYARGHGAWLKGRYFEIRRWKTFFKAWKEQMVTSDGRVIPLLVAIGNHDLESTHPDPRKKPVLFFEFFAMSEPYMSYRALDYGNYLSLILLDTGHAYPIAGTQTDWLKETLSQRQNIQQKMAIYHVSAYPSVYGFDKGNRKKIRSNWVPLFDEYGVQTVFEHHEHAFKRSYRIKGGKLDPNGVLYLGDGSWAVTPRVPVEAKERWYLAKTDSLNFVYLVSLQGETGVAQAISSSGTTFDQALLSP